MASDMSEMYDVMLSYSWAHKTIVHNVCDMLKERNIKVWIDKEQLTSGDIFKGMAEGVGNSRIIVPVISKEYKSSANCQRELNYAATQNKRLVPIRVEEPVIGATDSTELIIAGCFYFTFYNEEMLTKNFDAFYQAIEKSLRSFGAEKVPALSSIDSIQCQSTKMPTSTSSNSNNKDYERFSWFAGKLSRIEAELILDGHAVGAFLIRESLNDQALVLSVRTSRNAAHLKIEQESGQYYLSGNSFLSVEALINNYKAKPLTFNNISEKPTRLTNGVSNAEKVPALSSDVSMQCPSMNIPTPASSNSNKNHEKFSCFAGSLSRRGADLILDVQTVGAFLIREILNRQELVLSVRTSTNVKHIKIKQELGRYYITENNLFPSVGALISYYKSNSFGFGNDSEKPTKLTNGVSVIRRVVTAKFAWKATSDMELSFEAGQKVTVLNDESNLRWYGECNDKGGFLPSNYVE